MGKLNVMLKNSGLQKAIVLIFDIAVIYIGICLPRLIFGGGGVFYAAAFIAVSLLLLCAFEMYIFNHKTTREAVVTATMTTVIAAAAAQLLSAVLGFETEGAAALGCEIVLICVLMSLWRSAHIKMINEVESEKSILIIETMRVSSKFVRKLKYSFNGIKKAWYYILDEENQADIEHAAKLISEYDSVFISNSINGKISEGLFRRAVEEKKDVHLLATMENFIMTRSSLGQFGDTPVISGRCSLKIPPFRSFVKRVFDIVCSALGLAALSPIIGICALAVKLDSEGPVIYKQERYTINKKRFWVYKFRTMVKDAEKNGAQLSTKNDDRLTRVGKVLRRCRLDELPQLVNILEGTMSFVGPRPERPGFADEYCEKVENYPLRYNLKAGLTGYAQVYGRYDTKASDKILMDMIYAINYSFWLDIKLILLTVRAVFLDNDSAAGVETRLELLNSPEREQERILKSMNHNVEGGAENEKGIRNSADVQL